MLLTVAFALLGVDYLVVVPERAEAGYSRAAERLAKARKAEVVRFDGTWLGLERLLLDREPRQLALVLPPDQIDANLPRRLVPVLARFDDDPFVDCRWGLITGADGAAAARFVERLLQAPAGEYPARRLSATSVSVDRCTKIGPSRETEGVARRLERTDLWITGRDPSWEEFVERERDEAEGCGLVEWGHCGDPQGIWLFSMERNRRRDEHWPFEPGKVGQDPGGEMPRLRARDLLEKVDLFPAVVVNGACHSGVTCRAMVGADIVSTFGDTGGVVRFFDIEPADSFALAAIAHGATGYLAPLGANNANRAALETWWIERGGVPLGEVVRRTYDELVLGSTRRVLEFEPYEDGAAPPEGAPMFDDCVDRVLFGDPALVPWKDVMPTSHRVRVKTAAGAATVEVEWTDLQRDPWVWDPWLEERPAEEQGRIYERIELAAFPPGEPRVRVVEAAAQHGGEWKPLTLAALALVERDPFDRPVLHLKAQGPRRAMDARGLPGGPSALRAVFEIRWAAPETGR